MPERYRAVPQCSKGLFPSDGILVSSSSFITINKLISLGGDHRESQNPQLIDLRNTYVVVMIWLTSPC